MGSNSLNNRSAGQTIQDTFFNDIHQAMDGDFIGRGATGVPSAGQNLGTVAIPWGTIRGDALILDGAVVDTSSIVSPQNRVISGSTRSTSNQPAYIVPNGAAASFIVDGTPTSLVFDVNGTAVTVSTDIVKSSLTTAPASQNTALVNDVDAADQADTRTWGELAHSKTITIDTVGTNITALVGKWAAFKIVGVSTEYFLAYINSATELTNCFRGYYYGSTLLPMNRTGFSNNDVLTLMSLAWIFVENDSTTVDVTYNNPVWSFTSPAGAVTGDYWYDMGNNLWKRYDGASFQIINRTYIGQAILDATNCVGARSVDFYANYSEFNTVELQLQSTEIARTRGVEARANVAGFDIRFRNSIPTWNITTDLATSADMYNASEQISTAYYLYLTDDGDTVISDISPYWRADLYGKYHPHNPWRLVGSSYNDGSSNLVTIDDETYRKVLAVYSGDGTGAISVTAATGNFQFNEKIFDSHNLVVTGTDFKFISNRDGIVVITMQSIVTAGAADLTVYRNGVGILIIANDDGNTVYDGKSSLAVETGDVIQMRPGSNVTQGNNVNYDQVTFELFSEKVR